MVRRQDYSCPYQALLAVVSPLDVSTQWGSIPLKDTENTAMSGAGGWHATPP